MNWVRERGLAHAGHVLEQHVPPGQEGSQREADDLPLPVEDALDLLYQMVEELQRGTGVPGGCGRARVGHALDGLL